MRPGDQKSLVWQYFEISENGNKVSCNMCGKKLARTNSSTGNMLRHVIRQHHIPIDSAFNEKTSTESPKRRRKSSNSNEYQSGDYQMTLMVKESGNKSVAKAGNSSNQNENELNGKIVSDMILDIVVGDGNDFSIIHGKYFKRFVENILFGFKLPDEEFFIEKLRQNCENLKNDLKELLKFAEGISLTLEEYTTPDDNIFISLSVNFFSTFSLTNESYAIALKHLTDDDTADTIKIWMQGILSKFNINFSQVVSICSAKNKTSLLGKMCRDLCVVHGLYYHACPIELLKEIVQDSFGQVSGVADVIKNGRELVQFIQSVKIHEELETKKQELFNALEQAKLGLQLVDKNNWVTTLHMFVQLLSLQWQLSVIFSDDSISAEHPILPAINWNVLSALKDAIQPLKVAHDIMNGEKYTTLATLQPVVMGVMKQLKTNLNSTTVPEVVSFCEFTIKKLQTTFKFENLETSTCLKATFLDPRYKTATMSPELATVMKTTVENELLNENSSNSSSTFVQNNMANDSQEQLLNFAFTNDNPALNVGSDEVVTMSLVSSVNEVQEYLNSPKLALNGEPLQFWKANTETFPVLSQLARRYLCLPASSKSSMQQYINSISVRKHEVLLKSPHSDDIFFLYCNRYMSS